MAADPTRPVWQLSMGERQRVEILKSLWRNASVLVMDEPTAVLTPGEAAELGATLRAMAEEGRSVIYISHKLDQVVAFCDEATVLRQGKTAATVDNLQDVDLTKLAEMMVGTSGGGYVDRPRRPRERGPEVLSLQRGQRPQRPRTAGAHRHQHDHSRQARSWASWGCRATARRSWPRSSPDCVGPLEGRVAVKETRRHRSLTQETAISLGLGLCDLKTVSGWAWPPRCRWWTTRWFGRTSPSGGDSCWQWTEVRQVLPDAWWSDSECGWAG